MATSHDWDGTLRLVAPAGGITAGDISNDATDKVVSLALTTATSGNAYTGKVQGLVKGVSRVTGTAWTAGQRLAITTGSKFTHVTSGAIVVAHAAAAAASADTTGDVILCLPNPVDGT